jgi:hypothetical protein
MGCGGRRKFFLLVMYNMMYEVIAMAQMIRKQVYIQKRQQLLLRRLARARGVTEAEIIRQAIDQQVSGGRIRALPPDPEAWEKALALMRSLQAQGPISDQPRRWTRKELYEEREHRYGRRSD